MIDCTRLLLGKKGPGEALRFGSRKFGAGPVVVWNTTRRCNLQCSHCYSESSPMPDPDELTTREGLAFLEQLAAVGCPVVLLSGGEPLLRADIYELAARAASLGMRVVLSTNGTLIDDAIAVRLRDSGVAYVGVSLDGIGRANDVLRGVSGAFEAAVRGLRNARDAGIRTGVRFTMTAANVGDLPAVFDLVKEERIPRLCIYHLVYAGRARSDEALRMTPEKTRESVELIMEKTAELNRSADVSVLTVDNFADGPYLYLRTRREAPPRADEILRLLETNGGSPSGSRLAAVDSEGNVHADQFWTHYSFGSVSERAFGQIWFNGPDPLLAALREKPRWLKGRCRSCGFLNVCGGNMRVRAEAVHGDLWAPDPACYLTDAEIAKGDSQSIGRS